eukprot:scaffold75570_cov35-Tisochrysis_lutea.AAC.1
MHSPRAIRATSAARVWAITARSYKVDSPSAHVCRRVERGNSQRQHSSRLRLSARERPHVCTLLRPGIQPRQRGGAPSGSGSGGGRARSQMCSRFSDGLAQARHEPSGVVSTNFLDRGRATASSPRSVRPARCAPLATVGGCCTSPVSPDSHIPTAPASSSSEFEVGCAHLHVWLRLDIPQREQRPARIGRSTSSDGSSPSSVSSSSYSTSRLLSSPAPSARPCTLCGGSLCASWPSCSSRRWASSPVPSPSVSAPSGGSQNASMCSCSSGGADKATRVGGAV